MKKQFDVNHLIIDSRLQQATLATFQRRSIAFLIDCIILALVSEFFALLVLLVFAYLLLQKRVGITIRQGSEWMNKGLHTLDNQLASYDIEAQLRQTFTKVLRWGIYFSMFVILVLPPVLFIALLIDAWASESIGTYIKELVAIDASAHPLQDLQSGIKLIIKFLGGICYFAFFTHRWGGQSPGKRIAGIRVVRLNGKPLALYECFERASGYASSASFLLLGFLQFFWAKNHQTMHDKLADTIVIEDSPEWANMAPRTSKEHRKADTVSA